MSEQLQIETESEVLSFPDKTLLQPLGFEELVNSKSESFKFVEILTTNARLNESAISSGAIRVQADLVCGAYALVPGGWLPVPVAFPYKFIPDKNFVSDIETMPLS